MSAVVEVERVSKIYRDGFPRRLEVAALTNVSFAIPRGSVVALLGPNGAGKSTTIHLLLGFITPTSGTILVSGHPPTSPLSRQSLGFLPEVFAFDRFSTGRGLLERFDALSGGEVEGRRDRVEAALHAVELRDQAHRKIGTYSKGMTQRIGLAQALLGDVDLLILDEPMSGMDPASRRSVKALLTARHERGQTTLLSSHILSDIEELADHVLILRKGIVVANASLAELRRASSTVRIRFRFSPDADGADSLRELAARAVPAGEASSLECAEDELNAVLARLIAGRARIVSVNPLHGDLETRFLELTQSGQPKESA